MKKKKIAKKYLRTIDASFYKRLEGIRGKATLPKGETVLSLLGRE